MRTTTRDLLKMLGMVDDEMVCHCGDCRKALDTAKAIVAAHPEMFNTKNPEQTPSNCPVWGLSVAKAIFTIAEVRLMHSYGRSGAPLGEYERGAEAVIKQMSHYLTDRLDSTGIINEVANFARDVHEDTPKTT